MSLFPIIFYDVLHLNQSALGVDKLLSCVLFLCVHVCVCLCVCVCVCVRVCMCVCVCVSGTFSQGCVEVSTSPMVLGSTSSPVVYSVYPLPAPYWHTVSEHHCYLTISKHMLNVLLYMLNVLSTYCSRSNKYYYWFLFPTSNTTHLQTIWILGIPSLFVTGKEF